VVVVVVVSPKTSD